MITALIFCLDKKDGNYMDSQAIAIAMSLLVIELSAYVAIANLM